METFEKVIGDRYKLFIDNLILVIIKLIMLIINIILNNQSFRIVYNVLGDTAESLMNIQSYSRADGQQCALHE